MTKVLQINTLEELYQFLNEKGIMEIALRGKNKKFKTFQKIALDKLQQGEVKEKVQEAISLLNKKNNIGEQNLKMLGNVAKLNKFNLVLGGLNLCATCAGFAIMNAKLENMREQIAEIVTLYKKSQGIHADYEFKKILSEHSNMLDCRKKQNYYSEEQMRALVDGEYNVLDLLINVFTGDVSDNQETLMFSILSLAAMLSTTLKYFDEEYYLNNNEAIDDGNIWHLSHDEWMSVFDKLTSDKFIERIQDYGFFEMGLNTVENDCFYMNFYDQIKALKKDVEDNQTLIVAIDNPELIKVVLEKTNNEVKTEIEAALVEAGVAPEECEEALRAAAV